MVLPGFGSSRAPPPPAHPPPTPPGSANARPHVASFTRELKISPKSSPRAIFSIVERQTSMPAGFEGGHMTSTTSTTASPINTATITTIHESRGSAGRSSTSSSSASIGQHLFARRFTCAATQLAEQPVDNSPTLPPSSTPLDSFYQHLNYAGVTAHHWKHFTAKSTIGEKDASVMIFDKKSNVKAPARLGKINRLGLVDLLRYDVNQLAQLTHPRILRVLNALCENKELIAFAAEPVHQTLDRLLDQGAGGDGGVLDKLEMKLGVLQLIEGLSYLHNSAKILHGNLTPSAVFITSQQLWKVGNFAFSVAGKRPNAYPCFPWTKRLPACLQPDLDFLAPEYLDSTNQTVTTAADVWSMGVLICWIYAGGKRLIDVKNNLDQYQIVIDQIDVAMDLMTDELGPNLRTSLAKVINKDVEHRPQVQMLALIKHFDDPPLTALRQLDDIAQEFDPTNKTSFLSHTLLSALPNIPEALWFSRVLQRLNEHFQDSVELYPSLLRPLTHMLNHCESHNIHRLRPWFRRILKHAQGKALSQPILDNMPVIFRRLSDEEVEDSCIDLIIFLLSGTDPHLKQQTLRAIPHIVDFIPLSFVSKRLIPTLQTLSPFFDGHIPRQIDLLCAVAHLSDRCDSPTLHYLITAASMCNALHPAIVHSKSRLVQRILTCDVSRLHDPLVIAHHLLNPLVLGLALPELSPAHFDDVMSSTRILLDIIEQLRYESDEFKAKHESGRLCNRRVSMSSNHLPRLLITAARPSISGDGRKMSFLSADGRLEDRGSRRESRDSRCSLESEVSLRIGNGSDISDESALHSAHSGHSGHSGGSRRRSGGSAGRLSGAGLMQGAAGGRNRRQSWLEGYMHSVSLEQSIRPIGEGVRNMFDRRQQRWGHVHRQTYKNQQ